MEERHKLIPSVYLLLIKNNRILMIRRFNTGFMDGYYSLPAGHVERGETLTKAMVREAKEEIGIEINKEDLELVYVLHRKDGKDERINFFFTTSNYAGEPKIMEPDKCDDIGWFEVKNLPNNTVPYIRKVIDDIFSGKIYGEFGFDKK